MNMNWRLSSGNMKFQVRILYKDVFCSLSGFFGRHCKTYFFMKDVSSLLNEDPSFTIRQATGKAGDVSIILHPDLNAWVIEYTALVNLFRWKNSELFFEMEYGLYVVRLGVTNQPIFRNQREDKRGKTLQEFFNKYHESLNQTLKQESLTHCIYARVSS